MSTKKTKTTKSSTANIEDVVAVGKKNIESAVAATKENVEKASGATLKSYDDATDLNKSNLDALTASTNIWTKGVEDMTKAYFSFAQSNIDNAFAAGKAMMAVKTVEEAVELQSDLTRNNVDLFVAEGTKFSEMSYKVTTDVIEPIQSQLATSFEKLTKIAA